MMRHVPQVYAVSLMINASTVPGVGMQSHRNSTVRGGINTARGTQRTSSILLDMGIILYVESIDVTLQLR
jgi:hypothetical protein